MRMLPSPPLSGLFIGCLLILSGIVGCVSKDPVARGQVSAFGSRIDITLIGVNRKRAADVTRALEQDFKTMEAAWHAARPGPLSHINMLINEGSEPFTAPPSVLPLLKISQDLSQRSEGLFNPALGHLTRAWGFQSGSADCMKPPSQELIDQVLASKPNMGDINIDGLRIWSDNQTVKLDFRSIEKGFAMDRAIARLRELGINNASISIDGNIDVIGSRDGHPWSAAVRGPGGGGIFATLQIAGNEAVFTAGEYQNNFTWRGKVYHDILDPRTGYPATDTASVTVLHPNASTADAAATALFVAGPKDWHRLARKMGLRYVMLTDHEGRVYMSPAMSERVKLHRSDQEVIISEPLS